MHSHRKMKTFLLRVTVTQTTNDTDDVSGTKFTQWTDNTNCSPQVYWGVPVGYDGQSCPTSVNTLPLLTFLTARQGRQPLSTSQLKRLDTSHNRYCLMQCNRIRWHTCSAKSIETMKFKMSTMQNRVVCYPVFWSISHQTAFLRINWH